MTKIFDEHMQTAAAQGALAHAVEMSTQHRVCLLCYEADPACCHRKIVADRMVDRLGVAVIHL